MDDYIRRGDVLDIAMQYCPDDDGSCSKADVDPREMLDEIEALPATDVQPVKHGRWETWGYVFHGIAWKRCSACGKTADVSYQALLDGKIEMATPSICGCCGCRLDGDSE